MLGNPRYSSAMYAYTPPPSTAAATAKDPQAAHATLNAVLGSIRQSIEARNSNSAFQSQKTQIPEPTRWLLQIRTLRLVVPSQDTSSSSSSSTRTMYMVRNAADSGSVTIVIEDPARAAVNISTLAANSFDYFLSTNLLPPLGTGRQRQPESTSNPNPSQSQPQALQDPSETQQQSQQRAQLGRWIPRPSFTQIEGFTVQDPHSDFRISVGIVSARGGTSGPSASTTGNLVIQLEYLPVPFFTEGASYSLLEEYLSHIMPKNSTVRDLSVETTSLDWRSLLAIGPDRPELPQWSPRNTAWCLVKMCKAERLV